MVRHLFAIFTFTFSFQLFAGGRTQANIYNYTRMPISAVGDSEDCMSDKFPSMVQTLSKELASFSISAKNYGTCYGGWSSQKISFRDGNKVIGSVTVRIKPGYSGFGSRIKIEDNKVNDNAFKIYTYPGEEPISSWSKQKISIVIYRND